MATVNEKLLDKFIRHSVFMERFKASEAIKISNMLAKEVTPAVVDKMTTILTRGKDARRVRELAAALDIITKAGAVKAGKATIDDLTDLSKYEAEWIVSTIKKTVPLDIGMTMPSGEVLRQLVTTKVFEGHKLQTWMTGWSNAAKRKMMKQIRVGIVAGESLPAIGARMRKVMSIKRKQAEHIARTAVSSVVHNARHEVYKQNSNIIQKYQWVSTLDTRTTLTCINLDGQVFEVAKGPRPPIHFNCRSTTVPVILAWAELGIEAPPPSTRASMNGAVPASTNYRDWFKKQTAATKVQILGPTRYEAYRKGKSLKTFVASDYTPISIKKLKQLEVI